MEQTNTFDKTDTSRETMVQRMATSLFFFVLSMVMANAQTDSVTIKSITDQYPRLQPLAIDMSSILPEKQKTTTMFSFISDAKWDMLSDTFVNESMEADIRRSIMMPYWATPLIDDVRVQPVFKFKSGKNTFSFGLGVNMDAFRRGIDIQRMQQFQQQTLPRR